MSYNGSGTFNINTAGQPVVTGTVISSTAFNALTADLGTGLSTAITKNGQTTVTANIPFNGYKLTGIAVATASGDALSYGQAATVSALTDSALTSGRVPYASTAGLFVDSANLTFNGTTLTANTIGAFTLGGTVAGGGNQLNNIIIGTTTPLAGAFTTLSATGAVTSGSDFKVPTLGYLYAYTGAGAGTVKAGFQFDGAGAIYGKIADTTVTNISATGLAVTGTLSATRNTNSSAALLTLYNSDSANNAAYGVYKNAGGEFWIGLERSNGGAIITGGAAYDAVIVNNANTNMLFGNNATKQMTLDSSGNLGLGVTPSAWATVKPSLQLLNCSLSGGLANNGYLASNCYFNGSTWVGTNTAQATMMNFGTSGFTFNLASATANTGFSFTQAMTLDNSGRLLIGLTSPLFSLNNKLQVYKADGSGDAAIGIGNSSGTSTTTSIVFLNGNGTVGSIQTSGSLTLYNTTSDYRLKNVIGSITDAGKRIDALEPIEYDWNAGGRTRGFLAHKFAEVYPDSVSGEKDAVDADGKPIYQSMQASTSEVIADLVAEIQSLRARVAQLETKGV
jgi:hypothetical protein